MVTTLLRVLVEGTGEAVAGVLHEEVRFRQGDGTVHRGRAAVLTMFERSEHGTRHHVVGEAFDTVRVAVEVPGMPGAFSFLLCGRAEGRQLVEVWVEP